MAALAQLLLLFSPFLSALVIPGYEDIWWTKGMENHSSRPLTLWRVWNKRSEGETDLNIDLNRNTLDKSQPAKRFDEAQIQESLASNDESEDDEVSRPRDAADVLRQILVEVLKFQTRLKRSEGAMLSGNKEYITRLGKRTTELPPNKEYVTRLGKRPSWGLWTSPVARPSPSPWSSPPSPSPLWTSPVARHQMIREFKKDGDAEQIMKKADKI